MTIKIATRRSPLALWQAKHVAAALSVAEPGLHYELVAVDVAADRDLTRSIAEIGGKGAFSTSIQELVLSGRADIAVHSAKDLQAVGPSGLTIGAFPARGAAHDCLVGGLLSELAPGATVATGSARRRALLLDERPDLKIEDLRGNIGTRLSKLDDPSHRLDAIVVAAAALERLLIEPATTDHLDVERFVPQVGQGALAVEYRSDDHLSGSRLAKIDDPTTRRTVEAERSFLRELGGDCNLPAGAHATIDPDGRICLRAVLADAAEPARLQRTVHVGHDPDDLGRAVARRLRDGDSAGRAD